MGLQSALSFNGLDIPQAYWRLTAFHWDIAEPLTTRLELAGYASQQAFAEGHQPVATRSYAVDLTDENGNPDLVKVRLLVQVRTLSYLEIKNFPEMEGALDV